MVKDLCPIGIVDGNSFQQLDTLLEPGYKIPSRTNITSVRHRKFEEVKKDLHATLKAVPYVAITTDLWTS